MNAQGPVFAKVIHRDIERVVVSREQIDRRVRQLGREIAEALAGEEMTIVAVLTGALIFLADLIRRIPLHLRINVVSVSSYPGEATASLGPRLGSPFPVDPKGKHVLIVDDILDSGRTLGALLAAAGEMGPTSLQSCVLLRKDRPDLPARLDADFVGFDVPNEFLVGYGLDFDNLYRNLPDICVLKGHARREGGADTAEVRRNESGF